MSTAIKQITGLNWSEEHSHINPRMREQSISIRRFFGGLTFGGRAIQVTIGDEYVLLTKKQVRELAYTLMDCFDDGLYPSE